MSRGGLLLRYVRENRELNYINGTMLIEHKLNQPQRDSQQIRESLDPPLKKCPVGVSPTAARLNLTRKN